MSSRIPCVGAIITGQGRILLIRRGHEPEAGRWSLPGGRVEPGETGQQAVVREVREETGLVVSCGPLVGALERPWRDGQTLLIRDYAATVTGGELAPGDDAADARWAGPDEFRRLPLTGGLAETLAAWDALPWASSAGP
jgi:ADP-ribose pyrophosphatase YjhB (NUDIX family)